jgi:hypothetical protein
MTGLFGEQAGNWDPGPSPGGTAAFVLLVVAVVVIAVLVAC